MSRTNAEHVRAVMDQMESRDAEEQEMKEAAERGEEVVFVASDYVELLKGRDVNS